MCWFTIYTDTDLWGFYRNQFLACSTFITKVWLWCKTIYTPKVYKRIHIIPYCHTHDMCGTSQTIYLFAIWNYKIRLWIRNASLTKASPFLKKKFTRNYIQNLVNQQRTPPNHRLFSFLCNFLTLNGNTHCHRAIIDTEVLQNSLYEKPEIRGNFTDLSIDFDTGKQDRNATKEPKQWNF